MFEAVLIMLGIGAACGIVLSVASKVFYVWEDPRISQVEYFLSGANCGGCGYAGCSAAANAVVAGKAPPSVCIVAGAEAAIEIAAIMGVDPGTAEPLRSLNSCLGGHRAADKYYYDGAQTCAALANLHGGRRVCSVGCLGMGDCIRSCTSARLSCGRPRDLWPDRCRRRGARST